MGTSPVETHPTGRSKDGAFDLAGNVAEIVGSNFAEDFDKVLQDGRYHLETGAHGGSYASNPVYLDLVGGSIQFYRLPLPTVGFRCASSAPGKPQKPTI